MNKATKSIAPKIGQRHAGEAAHLRTRDHDPQVQ